MVLPVIAAWAHVHGNVVEPGHVVQKPVVGLVSDVVGLDNARPAVDDDAGFRRDTVAYPAKPQVLDVLHTNHRAKGRLSRVDQFGLDGVHQPSVDIGRCAAQNEQEGHGDQQPYDGSARGKPAITPKAPPTTANDVKPSVRACRPSAAKAAEPMLRPTRIR